MGMESYSKNFMKRYAFKNEEVFTLTGQIWEGSLVLTLLASLPEHMLSNDVDGQERMMWTIELLVDGNQQRNGRIVDNIPTCLA